LAIHLKNHIHAIASGSGDFADNHPFIFGQRIDESAFPHIATTNDRHFHLRLFNPLIIELGKPILNQLQQSIPIPVLSRADTQQMSATESLKLIRVNVHVLLIRFVGDKDDRTLDTPKPLDDQFVQRHQTGLYIHDQQNDVRRGDGRFDLTLDVRREIIFILDPHSAGVDQFKELAFFLQFDQCRHPVSGDTFIVVHDGQPPAGQPIEQTAFAHVWTTNDGDLGNGHDRANKRRTDEQKSKKQGERFPIHGCR